MNSRDEAIEQFAKFGLKGLFKQSGELAPVILGFYAKNFDDIELSAVRRQVTKQGGELFHLTRGECEDCQE